MREFTEGWEFGDDQTIQTGWSGSGSYARNNSVVNQDLTGAGGAWSIRCSFSSAAINGPTMFSWNTNSAEIREFWARVYMYTPTAGTGSDVGFAVSNNVQLTVGVTSAGTLEIRRGGTAGTLLNSIGGIALEAWNRVEIHAFIDDSTGFVNVYVNDDGTYSTPSLAVSGTDTKNQTQNYINNIILTGGANAYFDDIAVNSLSLLYDNGVGTATQGETITGGTSSATAEITGSIDLGGNTGILIVRNVVGTFQDNEAFTSTSLNGDVNAPNASYVGGLMPQSAAPGPGYVVYLEPTGNGNTSNLAGTDGNSVDNYLLVDDNPVNTTTEGVIGDADLEFDTYQFADLPGTATAINHVDFITHVLRDGVVVNNVGGVFRVNSTDYDTEATYDISAPASAATFRIPQTLSPDTGVEWTPAEINAAEAGPRVKA